MTIEETGFRRNLVQGKQMMNLSEDSRYYLIILLHDPLSSRSFELTHSVEAMMLMMI
jgi:hypothetical protein